MARSGSLQRDRSISPARCARLLADSEGRASAGCGCGWRGWRARLGGRWASWRAACSRASSRAQNSLGRTMVWAALLMRMSRRATCWRMQAMTPATWACDRKSHCIINNLDCHSGQSCSRWQRSTVSLGKREVTYTTAPSRSSRTAISQPILMRPPVTSAVSPTMLARCVRLAQLKLAHSGHSDPQNAWIYTYFFPHMWQVTNTFECGWGKSGSSFCSERSSSCGEGFSRASRRGGAAVELTVVSNLRLLRAWRWRASSACCWSLRLCFWWKNSLIWLKSQLWARQLPLNLDRPPFFSIFFSFRSSFKACSTDPASTSLSLSTTSTGRCLGEGGSVGFGEVQAQFICKYYAKGFLGFMEMLIQKKQHDSDKILRNAKIFEQGLSCGRPLKKWIRAVIHAQKFYF